MCIHKYTCAPRILPLNISLPLRTSGKSCGPRSSRSRLLHRQSPRPSLSSILVTRHCILPPASRQVCIAKYPGSMLAWSNDTRVSRMRANCPLLVLSGSRTLSSVRQSNSGFFSVNQRKRPISNASYCWYNVPALEKATEQSTYTIESICP